MTGGSGSHKGPARRPHGFKRGRKLSQTELDLWGSVARDIRPRDRSDGPPSAFDSDDPASSQAGSSSFTGKSAKRDEPPPQPAPKPSPPERRTAWPKGAVARPQGVAEPRVRYDLVGDRVQPVSSRVAGLDAATTRRLKRGEREPDSRIDLHGMTAERAHAALSAYLRREFISGSRLVLVITGKGGRREETDGPRAYAPGKGVLRTLTPIWLSEPPLCDMVVGVFSAHQRHGGGGALYVYLRKSRGRG